MVLPFAIGSFSEQLRSNVRLLQWHATARENNRSREQIVSKRCPSDPVTT
jgi:hypothetical protein